MRDIPHFIDGAAVAGASGRFGDVFNPNTGEVQARVQPLAQTTGASPGDAVRRNGYAIVAFAANHLRAPALGFALVEDIRLGRFNPDRARELGIPADAVVVEISDTGAGIRPRRTRANRRHRSKRGGMIGESYRVG